MVYLNLTTFRQTIPKHELPVPAKVQNDAKERRKEKEEGAEGKRQTFVFILATFEIQNLNGLVFKTAGGHTIPFSFDESFSYKR